MEYLQTCYACAAVFSIRSSSFLACVCAREQERERVFTVDRISFIFMSFEYHRYVLTNKISTYCLKWKYTYGLGDRLLKPMVHKDDEPHVTYSQRSKIKRPLFSYYFTVYTCIRLDYYYFCSCWKHYLTVKHSKEMAILLWLMISLTVFPLSLLSI